MINSGERNELLVKLRLIELRDKKQSINLEGKTLRVTSVGFGGNEYKSLPNNIDLEEVYEESNNDDITDLKSIAEEVGITKAASRDKADVFINGIGYSVKSLQSAPPALVNHTPRNGWKRICDSLNIDIEELDNIISEYWEKRLKGVLMEDVGNDNQNSPFKSHKDYLLPILNYFLFKGTGSKDSNYPADFILDFSNPIDVDTWSIHGKEYLDEQWGNLVFSVRHKGMPDSYPKCKNSETIKPWVRNFQGSDKGSLHVRIRG